MSAMQKLQLFWRDSFEQVRKSVDIIKLKINEIDVLCDLVLKGGFAENLPELPFNKGCLEYETPNGVNQYIFFEKMNENRISNYNTILNEYPKHDGIPYEVIFMFGDPITGSVLTPFTYIVLNTKVIPVKTKDSDLAIEVLKESGFVNVANEINENIKRFVMVMKYVSDFNPERVEIEEKRVTLPRKNSKHKKKTLTRKVITLTPVVNVYQKNEGEKQTREFTAESWTVRGHYRTFKNGKRSWIPPYTKGKGRVEPKTYRVSSDFSGGRNDLEE